MVVRQAIRGCVLCYPGRSQMYQTRPICSNPQTVFPVCIERPNIVARQTIREREIGKAAVNPMAQAPVRCYPHSALPVSTNREDGVVGQTFLTRINGELAILQAIESSP